MGRWAKGAERVTALIEARHLQRRHQCPVPGVPGLTSLDRLRRRRNQAEYPDPRGYDPITIAEANDAVTVANHCLSSAERLLELDQLGVF